MLAKVSIVNVFVLLFCLFFFAGKLKAASVRIEVDPSIVKCEDFGQILGGYLNPRGSMNPSNGSVLSRDFVIESARKMFPQPPEFDTPVVMRTQSYHMLAEDIYALTDKEVEDIIKFCSMAGCDPMFGAYGVGGGGTIDVSENKIEERVLFVRSKCREYFRDDRHCLHWDIGNEPPSTPANCEFYGKNLIPTAIRVIKRLIPNAVIHAPELYLDSARVRDSNETIGESIARNLNSVDSSLKIDVFTTHWYPYICGSQSGLDIDGEKVLRWEGNGGQDYQKMYYPAMIMNNFNSWFKNYEVTRLAQVGIGELNPMAACSGGSTNTYRLNMTWGGAFWHLDVLGIAAESGIKYVQKHVHIDGGNGAYAAIVVPGNFVVKTNAYYPYAFYAKYFAKKLVKSLSSSVSVVNAHSALDKQGNLRVLLINKTGQSVSVNIVLRNFLAKSAGEAYVMTAVGDFRSEAKPADEKTFFKEVGNVPVGNDFEYVVPGYSAVILKIPGGQSVCSCGTQRLAGDANCDNAVNEFDFQVWRGEFYSKTIVSGDFNCDGKVDGVDFELWRRSRWTQR